ncbi:MAG: hypothetical protein A3K09_01760 [Nitrospinae bacterium RIFCSPLOWO2_12_FULL_47_7]|nr:MAG: hypothetical protein A3K09_01760 [Nitrospinae bacterium RIFCSPLOWO2_12_FULL_47_7]
MRENHGSIPIFPLSTTIFYPNTYLPLHIFEPRYKQMVTDTLKEKGLIGIVIFKPGWEESYFQNPEIVSVGCVGKIEEAIRLEDGKYNIALMGLNRFRIVREITGKPYRQAEVEILEEKNDKLLDDNMIQRHPMITLFEDYLRLKNSKQPFDLDRCETLGHVADQIADELDMRVEQKQTFLEEQDVLQRIHIVQSLLDFKISLINLSKNQMDQGLSARRN